MKVPWTARKVNSTRIDKIIRELYKYFSKHSKTILEKVGQHSLSFASIEVINTFALHLQEMGNLLKQPWNRFRILLDTLENEM